MVRIHLPPAGSLRTFEPKTAYDIQRQLEALVHDLLLMPRALSSSFNNPITRTTCLTLRVRFPRFGFAHRTPKPSGGQPPCVPLLPLPSWNDNRAVLCVHG